MRIAVTKSWRSWGRRRTAGRWEPWRCGRNRLVEWVSLLQNLAVTDEEVHVPHLRSYLRRGPRRSRYRHTAGHQVGRCSAQLDLSRLRCPQGRLRADGVLTDITSNH